ncbi:hypothetical protein [Pseudovibrio exalbescens]|uniref:hypothetical protein n=1 Tax=Pseudovibrio exalbescens TaxID=197461 RepID=UPI001AD90C20|nr:hypothetical protein [Pseudovibrio exalbescens]
MTTARAVAQAVILRASDVTVALRDPERLRFEKNRFSKIMPFDVAQQNWGNESRVSRIPDALPFHGGGNWAITP